MKIRAEKNARRITGGGELNSSDEADNLDADDVQIAQMCGNLSLDGLQHGREIGRNDIASSPPPVLPLTLAAELQQTADHAEHDLSTDRYILFLGIRRKLRRSYPNTNLGAFSVLVLVMWIMCIIFVYKKPNCVVFICVYIARLAIVSMSNRDRRRNAIEVTKTLNCQKTSGGVEVTMVRVMY